MGLVEGTGLGWEMKTSVIDGDVGMHEGQDKSFVEATDNLPLHLQ